MQSEPNAAALVLLIMEDSQTTQSSHTLSHFPEQPDKTKTTIFYAESTIFEEVWNIPSLHEWSKLRCCQYKHQGAYGTGPVQLADYV